MKHGRLHGGDFRRLVRNLRTGQHITLPILQLMKRRPAPPSPAELAALVEAFNKAAPVGTWITYREVMPEGLDPGTEARQFKVRTAAYVHQGHTAAVFLEGKSGFVCVTHCEPTSPAACPYDTDGDGNCGRPACPVCGPIANPAAFPSNP